MVENDINGTFDEEFCQFLEYRLSAAFQQASGWQYAGYWCDGVLMPHQKSQITKKSVNDSREIITDAYTGEGGNTRYLMTISLGRSALSRYARGLRLEECVPESDTLDWVTIDDETRTIEIRLK